MTESPDHHILIVDDDQEIRNLLGRFLTQHQFVTHLAENGTDMFRQLEKHPHMDLIILDIMMPGEDGLTLCRKLRSDSSIPIIMLTAIGEEIDRIVGLEMGADDYISKPFNPRELLARVKAILRRSAPAAPSEEEVMSAHLIYYFADWSLNVTTRQLTSPTEEEVGLSSGEFDLLVAFLERPQQVLSRDALLDLTKNREAGPFDRSIDIQISRLRHKIEENPKVPTLIKTVRGGGYVLSTTVKKAHENMA